MKKQGKKRQVIGTVVSDKMDKTIVVLAETLVKHQLYQKYIKRHKKFKAHDKDNTCRVGDKVIITESRPLSKTKKWRVSRVVQKAV